MKVQLTSLDDLRPYHRNPRDHEQSVPDLKESIQKFGFRRPIEIDADGTIITGHGRFKAVQELAGTLDERISSLRADDRDDLADNLSRVNQRQIYAVRSDQLSEREKQEYRITDNKVQDNTDWLTDELTFELRELEGAVGFDDEEISEILDIDVSVPGEDVDGDGQQAMVEGRVDEEKERLDNHYQNLSESKNARKVELVCPNCLDSFYVDETEYERAKQRAIDEAGE